MLSTNYHQLLNTLQHMAPTSHLSCPARGVRKAVGGSSVCTASTLFKPTASLIANIFVKTDYQYHSKCSWWKNLLHNLPRLEGHL